MSKLIVTWPARHTHDWFLAFMWPRNLNDPRVGFTPLDADARAAYRFLRAVQKLTVAVRT